LRTRAIPERFCGGDHYEEALYQVYAPLPFFTWKMAIKLEREFSVDKIVCLFFAYSALTLLVGVRKGFHLIKNLHPAIPKDFPRKTFVELTEPMMTGEEQGP